MKPSIGLWLFFRAGRWLAWIGFFGYCLHFVFYRQDHISNFGQLLPGTEAAMFGFAIAGVFAGYFELMMREKAGLQRPSPGRLMPKAVTPLR